MMNNIILNGVNSNTIQGLIIQELPPISKPAIRTEIEEIDGRDGDVITKLGYAAYDKQLSIGLYGNYDINQVISFFNTSGTVIFSNEPDKYYNYQILNEIDFERLVRFRTAIVTMHVQPFKYSATETPQELSGTVVTGEGSNINLVNTTDSGLFTDLQKKGDTEQQTYSGKNIFNISEGIIVTARASGSVSNNVLTVETTSTSSTYSLVVIPIPNSDSLLGKTVTLSANMSTNGGSTRIAIYQLKSNGGFTGSSLGTLTTNGGSITITMPSSYTTDATQFGLLFYSRYNSTGSVGSTSTYSNIMLELGSIKTDYEPYVGGTPSPNPDYPQEIKTVTGNNSITICGKNLFNKNTVTSGYINADGSITSSGSYVTTDYIGIDSTKQYTKTITNSPRIKLYDENKQLISTSSYNDIISFGNAGTYSIPYSNAKYIRFTIRIDNTDIDEVMLEQGSTATDYEAYQSQTYPISLGNIELCSINGTGDYIYKNNGTWYLHKAIGKVVFNGTESWGKASTTAVDRFYISFSNLGSMELISNYFVCSTSWVTTLGTIMINTSRNQLAINYSTYNTTTLTQFKNWLSTHNTDVYYLLQTPTDTEITNSTLLSQLNALGNATTYLGTTNISTSGDGLSPILYVETVAVDDPTLKITNSGNTTAKPIMTLYGTGTINLSLNGEQIFVIDLSSENYITIDVANMEAYYNGILKNRLVTGNYENFVLNQGENEITFTGTLYSLTISNYSRWI